jgi:hypothetical protein
MRLCDAYIRHLAVQMHAQYCMIAALYKSMQVGGTKAAVCDTQVALIILVSQLFKKLVILIGFLMVCSP